MMRISVLMVLLPWFAPTPAAFAGDLRPICLVPSVLDVMAHELRKREYNARFDPRAIAEIPDAAPNSVWCGVTVWVIGYDARVADGIPIVRWEQHAFRVQALAHGFVVRYLQ